MGPEEDARVILAAMFDRIVRGPHVALDIDPDAPPAEVRAAFHTLAKQYHPARFGRMSHDTQRLANEVFLGLRMAHDSLMKSAGRQTTAIGVKAPGRSRESTQPPPTGQQRQSASGSQPLQPLRPQQPPERRTGPIPIIPAAAPERRSGPIPIMRPAIAPTTNIGRPAPPPAPAPATGTGPRPIPQRGGAPPVRPTPSGPLPIPPGARPSTQQNPVVAQPRSPAQDGIRIAGTRPPSSNPRIMSAIELLNRQQWEAARSALAALATESPESNQVRGLLAYATGRQAQFERRLDEARVELQRALQFDPDLTLAKTALAELFARRK